MHEGLLQGAISSDSMNDAKGKLTCELTIEDLMVGTEHTIDSDPRFAAGWRKEYWNLIGGIVAISVLAGVFEHRWDWSAIGLVLGIVLGIRAPTSYRRAYLLSARSDFEATSQKLLGPRKYSIEQRGLRAVTQVTDETIFWSSITDIVQLPQHVLMVVGQLAVLVIANERVIEGDADDFCRQLISVWKTATDIVVPEATSSNSQ